MTHQRRALCRSHKARTISPEGLEPYADTVLVLSRGRQLAFGPIAEILDGGTDLAAAVARRLEAE